MMTLSIVVAACLNDFLTLFPFAPLQASTSTILMAMTAMHMALHSRRSIVSRAWITTRKE